MRVALLSREYPPEVYGGAGVHVQHLATELARYVDLDVHCFGTSRPLSPPVHTLSAYHPWEELEGANRNLESLRTMSVDLAMAAQIGDADVVHSHTWYTNLAGHFGKLLYNIPHVATVHSLEPKRPWKKEQLGTGYQISSFCERTGLESADAIIAVSKADAEDIAACYPTIDHRRITVIHNAIDIQEWFHDPRRDVLDAFGIDPDRPIVLYVGRITPQKGLDHLLAAVLHIDPAAQIVLRAGPADTPELELELAKQMETLGSQREGIYWIKEFLDSRQLRQLLSNTTVSCCPSVYEPFGLVNLEAMACEVPVVASAVGGIPEIVEDGMTGILVPFEHSSEDETAPDDPQRFAKDLAGAINVLVANPHLARKMGELGRRRVIDNFSWAEAARRTFSLYQGLTSS